MFGSLKAESRVVYVSKDEDVKKCVAFVIHMQHKTFFSVSLPGGITKLVECWIKCIDKGGENVEK